MNKLLIHQVAEMLPSLIISAVLAVTTMLVLSATKIIITGLGVSPNLPLDYHGDWLRGGDHTRQPCCLYD
jgi:hypothetical protein